MQVIRTACVTTAHGSAAFLAAGVRITSNAADAASHTSRPCLRANGANRSAANSSNSLAWGLLRHPCSARCSSRARSPSLVRKSALSGWGVDGVVDDVPVSAVPVVGVVVWVMVVPPDKQVRTPTPDSGGSGVVVLARVVIAGHHAQLIPTADRPGTTWLRPWPNADNGANRAARSPTCRAPTVMPCRVF